MIFNSIYQNSKIIKKDLNENDSILWNIYIIKMNNPSLGWITLKILMKIKIHEIESIHYQNSANNIIKLKMF